MLASGRCCKHRYTRQTITNIYITTETNIICYAHEVYDLSFPQSSSRRVNVYHHDAFCVGACVYIFCIEFYSFALWHHQQLSEYSLQHGTYVSIILIVFLLICSVCVCECVCGIEKERKMSCASMHTSLCESFATCKSCLK